MNISSVCNLPFCFLPGVFIEQNLLIHSNLSFSPSCLVLNYFERRYFSLAPFHVVSNFIIIMLSFYIKIVTESFTCNATEIEYRGQCI